LKKNSHLILIVQSKILKLNLKIIIKKKPIYAIYTRSGSFRVFLLKP
jgi:hypothetical protein